MSYPEKLVIALPKGRILDEAMPLVIGAGIHPEAEFDDPHTRLLRFATDHPHIDIIRVRSFDVATFVAFGAAHFGICGNDVLMEFDYPEIYAPLDLGIGRCRLCIAEPADARPGSDGRQLRYATKFPNLTRRYLEARGVVADVIKLSGSVELGPLTGLSDRIVDLVSSGETLRQHHLREVETIFPVSARLCVGRVAAKLRGDRIDDVISRLRRVI